MDYVGFVRIKNGFIWSLLLFCKITAYDGDNLFEIDSTETVEIPETTKAGFLSKKYNNLPKQMQDFLNAKSRKGAAISHVEFSDFGNAKREELLKMEKVYLNKLKNAFYGEGTIPPVDPLSTTADFGYSGSPPKIMRQHWTHWTNCSASCTKAGTRVRSLVCRSVASEADPNPKCFVESKVIGMETLKCRSNGECPLPWKDRFLYIVSMSWALVLLIIFITVLCFRQTVEAALNIRSSSQDELEGRHVKFEKMVNLIQNESIPNLPQNLNASHVKRNTTEGFSNNNITSAEEVEYQECMVDEETSAMSDPTTKNESSPNSVSSASTPEPAEHLQTFPDTDGEDSESYYTPEKLAALKRILASTIDRGQGTTPVEMVEESEADSYIESVNSPICNKVCRCPHHTTRVDKEGLPSNFVKMHEKYHRPDLKMKPQHKTLANTHSAPQPPRRGVRFSSIGFRERSSGKNSPVTIHHPNQTEGRNHNKNNNACFGLVSLNQVIFTTGKMLKKMGFGIVPPSQSVRSRPKRDIESTSDIESIAYSPHRNVTKKQKNKVNSGTKREPRVTEECRISIIPDNAESEPQPRNHNFNELAKNLSNSGDITLKRHQEGADLQTSFKSSSSDPRKCKSKRNPQKNSATKRPFRIPMRKCTQQNIGEILKRFGP